MERGTGPDPDVFRAAAAMLGIDPRHSMVVGDSVWDLLAARRAGALGVGLLSGGYGREELERAGAYRVYAQPAQMLGRIDRLGVRGDQRGAGGDVGAGAPGGGRRPAAGGNRWVR